MKTGRWLLRKILIRTKALIRTTFQTLKITDVLQFFTESSTSVTPKSMHLSQREASMGEGGKLPGKSLLNPYYNESSPL